MAHPHNVLTAVVFGFFCALAALPAPAATDPEPPAAVFDLAALKAGHYAHLEKALNRAQRDYEQGNISDIQLFDHFYDTDGRDPALEPRYQAWIRQYPHSYPAHLALGTYYLRAGQSELSLNATGQLTHTRFDTRQAWLEKADRELQRSRALTGKPLLSDALLIETRQYRHDPEGARHFLDAADVLAPDNLIARRAYMHTLERRWYGDARREYDFLRVCKAAGLGHDQLDALESLIYMDMGHDLADNEKFDDSLRQYRKADALSEAHAPLMVPADFAELWTLMARSYQQMDQPEQALAYAERGLKFAPDNPDMLNVQAHALITLKRNREALPCVKRLAAQGDSWAQNTLAVLRRSGVVGEAKD